MKRTVFFSIAGLAASAALAGEVDVPNQFQAGSAAVAAEVNANFTAIEGAVDDNAQDIAANAQDIAANGQDIADNSQDIADNAQNISALQDGLATTGIAVRIDGVVVGRYLGHGSPPVEVDIAPSTGISGTVRVAEASSLNNSGRINVMSATGYRFSIATSDIDQAPRLAEGQLSHAPLFFDDATCTGNTYLPVEGTTGFFSTFTPGEGQLRPAKRWAFRQGTVFASPDPNDPTPVRMIRRGQTAQTAPLRSLLIWLDSSQQPFCVDMANIPAYDANDPNDVDHAVFVVEPADPIETGVSGILGGQITVGL